MKAPLFAILSLFTLTATIVPLTADTYTPEKGGEKSHDPAYIPITDVPGLPRVLLIGDSVSVGYTLPVRDLLKGKANVHRIGTNGRSSEEGLKGIKKWLGTEKWDVIHFNFGLHDLKHWNRATNQPDPAGPPYNSVEQYENNLRALLPILKASGAKLIWATTTPIAPKTGDRTTGDEVIYNTAAARVMNEAGIPIDDLYAAALPKLAEIQLHQNVHFTPAGSQFLAEKVAESIEQQLPMPDK